ncbi:MORN motif precursor [Pelomyxa schiedti]|nr:MORN motif precursor [Pelomyxa schiedti]
MQPRQRDGDVEMFTSSEQTTEDLGSSSCTYRGRLVDGLPDGNGSYTFPDGATYDGEWRRGARHGRGVYQRPAGPGAGVGGAGVVRCDGEWRDDVRDGWNVCRNPDGGWFEGLWRGHRWARGAWHDPNGVDVLDGSWAWSDADRANKMQGWGVHRRAAVSGGHSPDGASYGIGAQTVYEGEWDGDRWHGVGTWRSPSGDIYDGQFDHGKRSGTGRILFGDNGEEGGGSYVGGWKDDAFHGRGVRLWANGTRYEGDWDMGSVVLGTVENSIPLPDSPPQSQGYFPLICSVCLIFVSLGCLLWGIWQKRKLEARLKEERKANQKHANLELHQESEVLIIKETDLDVVMSRNYSRPKPLGTGAYGTVFKAMHVPSSRDVALKVLHKALRSSFNVARFRLETEIVSGLRHPNIVKCLGTCKTASGKLLIVSELMCCSLRQLLSQKLLNFHEVVAIALGVSRGMDNLHKQDYTHGDLTSNNILLDSHGTPKISDFGLSRAMNSQRPGTAAVYMAPGHCHTSKGDVWSFGILLAEMIHGVIPDSAVPTLPGKEQNMYFLEQQRRALPPSDVEEVDRLCRVAPDFIAVVAESLGRRNACLSAVSTIVHSPDSLLFTRSRGCESAAVDALGTQELLFLITQSCLSICEKNRLPFTVIEQLLFSCASAAVASSSGVCVVARGQVNDAITQWLLSLAPVIASLPFPPEPPVNLQELSEDRQFPPVFNPRPDVPNFPEA